MQVAKNEFLGGLERNLQYKILQIHYALMLERKYTKDEILERYLNTVFFGNNAYGIQAAAETYFGKTVDQLTSIQAAFLAGLVRSPSGVRPDRQPRAQPGPVRPGDRPPRGGGHHHQGRGRRPARPRHRVRDPGPGAVDRRGRHAAAAHLLHRGAHATTCSTGRSTRRCGGARRHAGGAVRRRCTAAASTSRPRSTPTCRRSRRTPATCCPTRHRASTPRSCRSTPRRVRSGRWSAARGSCPAIREVNLALAPRQTGFEHEAVHPRRRAAGRGPGRRHHRRRSGRACCPTRVTRTTRSRSPTPSAGTPDTVRNMTVYSINCAYARLSQVVGLYRVVNMMYRMAQSPYLYLGQPSRSARRSSPTPASPPGANEMSALDMAVGRPDDRQPRAAHDAVLRRDDHRPRRQACSTPTTTRAPRCSTPASPLTAVDILKGVLTEGTGRRHPLDGIPSAGKTGHPGGQHQRLVRRLHPPPHDGRVDRRPERPHSRWRTSPSSTTRTVSMCRAASTRPRSGRRTWSRPTSSCRSRTGRAATRSPGAGAPVPAGQRVPVPDHRLHGGGQPVTPAPPAPDGFASPQQAPPTTVPAAATGATGADGAGAPGVRPSRRRHHHPAEQPRRQRAGAERAVEPGPGGPRVLSDDLLELQRLDTRSTSSPTDWRRCRSGPPSRRRGRRWSATAGGLAALDVRQQELAAAVERRRARRRRTRQAHASACEAQLKTVIAPREAEALMHELDTLAAQRDTLDDTELALLEEQSQLLDDIERRASPTPALERSARRGRGGARRRRRRGEPGGGEHAGAARRAGGRHRARRARRLRAPARATSTASPSPSSRAAVAAAATSTCRPASTSSSSPPRRRRRSATARSAGGCSSRDRRLSRSSGVLLVHRARPCSRCGSCSATRASTTGCSIVGSVLPDARRAVRGGRRHALGASSACSCWSS